MSTYALTIIEPQLSRIIAGDLTTLWRVGIQMQAYSPGDLLWIREPFYLPKSKAHLAPSSAAAQGVTPIYAADLTPQSPAPEGWLGPLMKARTMPRTWHRQHLLIETVDHTRRLHSITPEEMAAQGFAHLNHFIGWWNKAASLAGPAFRWDLNPLVTAITFARIGAPLP